LDDSILAEALVSHLPVVVFVESSVPSLEVSSILLYREVNRPHFLPHEQLFRGQFWFVVGVSWLTIDPLELLFIVVNYLLLLKILISVKVIGPLLLGSHGANASYCKKFSELHFQIIL
jgi:hypothetical protein